MQRDKKMELKELLLSFQGRISRKTFWQWNAVYYFLVIAFSAGMSVLLPTYTYILLPLFLLVLLVPDLAITTKRWHDRGKSIYWLALNIPLLLGRVATPFTAPNAGEPSALQLFITAIAFVCGAWILVECGFLKGDDKENQYGPNPAGF